MMAAARLARLQAWLAGRGARLERLRYPRPGGETEAFRWVPAGRPRGRVLVAHGAGNDALFPLLALGRALVEAGLEPFFFDLDGHGAASTSRFSPDGAEGALAAAAERAGRGRPEAPLHVVGHSLGAALALHALGTAPALAGVRRAALLSLPLHVRVTPGAAAGELAGFLSRATLAQREHYGLWGLVPAVGPFRRGAYPFRVAPEAAGRGPLPYLAAVNALLARLRLEEAAPRVRAPTLLLCGARDRLVPPWQARRLLPLLPSARLLEVPRATHWSLPFEPGAVRTVVDWMNA